MKDSQCHVTVCAHAKGETKVGDIIAVVSLSSNKKLEIGEKFFISIDAGHVQMFEPVQPPVVAVDGVGVVAVAAALKAGHVAAMIDVAKVVPTLALASQGMVLQAEGTQDTPVLARDLQGPEGQDVALDAIVSVGHPSSGSHLSGSIDNRAG
jgi:hypothetical protein